MTKGFLENGPLWQPSKQSQVPIFKQTLHYYYYYYYLFDQFIYFLMHQPVESKYNVVSSADNVFKRQN